MPKSVLQAAVDHDGKGTPLSLSGRGIGNGRPGVFRLLRGLLDVFDREVGSDDRLLMRRQGFPDAHQRSVRARSDTGLTEIRVWGTKRESVDLLVQRSQGVYIVADDLEVLNGHLEILPCAGEQRSIELSHVRPLRLWPCARPMLGSARF